MYSAGVRMKLTEAILLAVAAHGQQRDKQGEVYVLHSLRVMLAVPPEARVVAVLHDVLEDTETTMEMLVEAGLREPDVTALELVTRPEGEDRPFYREWIRLICAAPGESGRIARAVKEADIRDNLNRLTPSLAGLEGRYVRALRELRDAA